MNEIKSEENSIPNKQAAGVPVVSDSASPTLLTQREVLTDSPLYYTGDLNGGYGNTEVVTQIEFEKDIPNEDEGTFTATPAEPFNFLSHTSYEDTVSLSIPSYSRYELHRKQRHLTKSDIFKTLDFQTSNESDDASYGSESCEEFNILSDDETQLSLTSSDLSESDDQDVGNLPNFDKLDVVGSIKTKLSSPPNALVSKRIPTATVTHLLEPNSPETRVNLNANISATETVEKEYAQPVFTKSDIGNIHESSAGTFCSTKVQTALLGKLTTVSEPSDLSMVTSFTKPESSSASGRKSKSPVKQISPRRTKTDIRKHSFKLDVKRDLDIESEVDKAVKESVNKGSVLPLLKQELQCKIQVRRLSRGEPELTLEPEEPKTYELTKEEIEKRNHRLRQNRRSAHRSRQKAKVYEEMLQQIIKKEMTKHAQLTKELSGLLKRRDEYKAALDDHVTSCKGALEET